MPWTTTIDAKTGEEKRFWLDAGFGCRKNRLTIRADDTGNWRGQSPRSVTPYVWAVRWNRSRVGQAPDMQEKKYRIHQNARNFCRSLRRRGYINVAISKCENGLHEVWD